MKKMGLILLVLLMISGCKSVEINSSKLQNRVGVAYEVNKEKAFTGTSISKYENGQIKERTQYKKGLKDGEYIKYYENGVKNMTISYEDGLKEGKCRIYSEKGQLLGEVNYEKGEIFGKQLEYYETGELKSVINHSDSIGNVDSVISYYKNGNKEMEYIDKTKEVKIYYESENLKGKGKMNAKGLNGEFEVYYESGELEKRTIFKDGKENGSRIGYDKEGNIISQEDYKDSRRMGLFEKIFGL